MSLEEREVISRGLAQRQTLTAISSELGLSVSTVSWEVTRNVGPNGYRAARADRLATVRIARPRAGKLADDPTLRRYVEDKLTSCSSRQQISRLLLVDFPGNASMRVSHETIYTSLLVQTKAILPGDLTARLRTRRVRRRPHRRVNSAAGTRHPPVDRDVINDDAALGEQFLHVAVRQPVAQYQCTATAITSRGRAVARRRRR